MSADAVSGRARHYLLKAGIDVPRPGSHTLRHTCVQRLVDADFAFKTWRQAPRSCIFGDAALGAQASARRPVSPKGKRRRVVSNVDLSRLGSAGS
jgi:hypothetical protein